VTAPDFATVGDNCIDRFLPPADEWLVGGNAVNVAVQLALLGRTVSYYGAVGRDAAGDEVRKALIHNAVALSGLITDTGNCTAYTNIEMSDDGDRSFVFEEFGACQFYAPSDTDIAALRRTSHVHIGWLNDGGRLKAALAQTGATVSQDLSVNNAAENLSPAGLDIAFCSALPEQAETLAGTLIARGARLAVVTMGAAGSLAFDGSTLLRATAAPVTPEDTTGAGDAFIAGFLDAHARRLTLADCLSFASQRAALACLYRGGFPQKPLTGMDAGGELTET
jgi:fructoselysine 6-kinase